MKEIPGWRILFLAESYCRINEQSPPHETENGITVEPTLTLSMAPAIQVARWNNHEGIKLNQVPKF